MTELKPIAESDSTHVPTELKEFEQDIWVLWDGREKVPLAPWATGDMYRAGWGDGVVADPDSRMDERPETDYETAKMFADMDPAVIHQTHSFPLGEHGHPNLPMRVIPTILLPHYPPDPPIMFVDFDDVRDPESGEITYEVRKILERLDAYVEVSSSGAGLHAYVRAELPGGLGKFIGDLEEEGHIEFYDHGRFTGATWHHVAGTPPTVPRRQDVVDDLIQNYETDAQRKRREGTPGKERDIEEVMAEVRGGASSPRRSPYFDIDIRDVADRGQFGSYRKSAPQGDWVGPHPSHGPESSAPGDCTNFHVEPHENVWYCFAHGLGGGPLSLVAVLAGVVDCGGARTIHEDRDKLLEACLAARDDFAQLDGEDPPYEALLAIADRHDLAMADPESEILGEDAWRIARIIYANETY